MKAAIVKPGQKDSAQVADVPVPEPGPGEVRVKVTAVGMDGTDIDINDGLYGEAPPGEGSLIIGHEAVGMVEKAGPDVTGISEGELVVPTVRRGCADECPGCRYLEPDMCLTGNFRERGILGIHGFMAEYFTEKPDYLLKVPPELREIGVWVEPLSVCEKAVDQIFKIQERLRWSPNTALVLGAGNIGLLSTLLLRSLDIETHTVDIEPEESLKAGLVRKVGANYIDARDVHIPDMPNKIGNPDFIIEATGHSASAFDAMGILRNNGILCVLSVTGGTVSREVCTDCIVNTLVMGNRVVFGSVSSNRGHYQKAIDRMLEIEGRWPGIFNQMITKRLSLEDFKIGLKKTREDIKPVVMTGA